MPLLSNRGTSFVQAADGIYTLAPALPRDDIFDPIAYPALYANIGRAIGKLHKALADYPGEIASWTMDLPGRVRNDLVPLLTMRLAVHERPVFDTCVVAHMEEICDALADLPMQYIHGDCHGGNVLLYQGDVSGFIDLDHLPIGPRIYDVSYFLVDRVKNAIYDPAALRAWLDQFDGLLAGYASEIPPTAREKHALWYGMVVSQLLFVNWFLEHQNAAHVTKNLAVLDWVCEHQQEIESKIYAKL
jgi:Ser/Thr protein kinase RdoA (MazF antagonist)